MSDNLTQPASGYRYSLDPFILAGFARQRLAAPAGRVIDLGTGSGILVALLQREWTAAAFVGIDIRRDTLPHARENAPGALFVNGDIRDAKAHFPSGEFDVAVSNPPFRKVGDGRMNPDPAKAVARHEVALTLEELIASARHLLRDGGVFALCHLAERSGELLHLLHKGGFAPRTIRFAQSRAGENAFLVLVEAVKGGRNRATVPPPLVVYGPDGEYTPEMAALYGALGEG